MSLPTPTPTITFLTAVQALHSDGMFQLSCAHNGKLTEAEYNEGYREITGTTSDGTMICAEDPSDFTVSYAQALAKYDELIAE